MNTIVTQDVNQFTPMLQSKIIVSPTTTPTTMNSKHITLKSFANKTLHLQKFKIPDLKVFLKTHNLPVSGTKPQLIARIQNYFIHLNSAIIIQKYFRRFVVEMYLNHITLNNHTYHGCHKILCKNDDKSLPQRMSSLNAHHTFRFLKDPELLTTFYSKFTNTTDGFTLEPIDEIHPIRMFIYTDSNGYTYAFDVFSLYSVYLKTGKIANPYTRELFDIIGMSNVVKLFNYINILYPYLCEDSPITKTENKCQCVIIRGSSNVNLSIEDELRVRLHEIRQRPINQRIEEIFEEINNLGNYTSALWFNNLSTMQYIRLYNDLYRAWNFGLNISHEDKRKICQLHNPFYNTHNMFYYSNRNLARNDFYRSCCLSVFENWIYCGIDEEYRKLGALQVLTIFCGVSVDARRAMHFLY